MKVFKATRIYEEGAGSVSLWYHHFRLNCFCRFGLKTLLLDGNPLGSNGLNILTPGLRYNDTIQHFGISECGFRSDAMKQLKTVLEENSTILRLDTNRNRVTQDVSAAAHAEIEANNCVLKLTGNVHAVDANKLSIVVSTYLVKCDMIMTLRYIAGCYLQTRKALEKKLRFLPMGVLELLHNNPSFNKVELLNAYVILLIDTLRSSRCPIFKMNCICYALLVDTN